MHLWRTPTGWREDQLGAGDATRAPGAGLLDQRPPGAARAAGRPCPSANLRAEAPGAD